MQALCENPMTAEAFSALQAGWSAISATDRTSVLQHVYTSASMSSATEKGLSLTTPGQLAYDAAHKKYHAYFTKLLDAKGFTDGYLFDLDGNCIYSVTKKSDFATSFLAGPYASSSLGQAFRAAKSNAQRNIPVASLVDFSPYAPAGTVASFAATGIFNPKGLLLGVAAVLQPSYVLRATSMPEVKSAMTAFRSAWGELAGSDGLGGARVQLQKAYISDNPYPLGSKDMLGSAPRPEAYHAVHKQYHEVFRKLVEERGYYDAYLIDLDGNCIYSVAKQSDFGTNVVNGPYALSGIGRAFTAAKNSPKSRSSIDFSAYEPSQGALAKFLSMGVFGGDVQTGIFIAQVPLAVQVATNAIGDRVESCVLPPLPPRRQQSPRRCSQRGRYTVMNYVCSDGLRSTTVPIGLFEMNVTSEKGRFVMCRQRRVPSSSPLALRLLAAALAPGSLACFTPLACHLLPASVCCVASRHAAHDGRAASSVEHPW